MLTIIFIIGFILLAIFIPQATSGLTWQELIKILQEIDDQWLKEIVATLNLEYTTPTQFATQQILICAGILIAYIVACILVSTIIKRIANKQNGSQYHEQSKEIELKLTLKQKLEHKKFKIWFIIWATSFSISLLSILFLIIFGNLISNFTSSIIMVVFFPSAFTSIISFIVLNETKFVQKNDDNQQTTILQNSQIDKYDIQQKTEEERNINNDVEKTKTINIQNKTLKNTNENKTIKRPQVNIKKIRELQQQLKNQNAGENTNE